MKDKKRPRRVRFAEDQIRRRVIHQNLQVRLPPTEHIGLFVPVIVHQKLVRARINTGAQETVVGVEIERFVNQEFGVTSQEFVVRNTEGSTLIREIRLQIGMRPGRMKTVVCRVDESVPPYSMSLGMVGMETLEMEMRLGGIQAERRTERVSRPNSRELSVSPQRGSVQLRYLDPEEDNHQD